MRDVEWCISSHLPGNPAEFVTIKFVVNTCSAASCSCPKVIYFRTTTMKPYSVSLDGLERGYAKIDQCKPLTEIGVAPWKKQS